MTDGTIGTWSYRAGGWFAVFGSTTTLLLPESERERVVGLWAQVDGGAAFAQVLDGLLASGLSSLPGFVLVDAAADGPTRVLLRGEGVRATLTTDAETVELEGAAASTWVERTVDGVTSLSVTVDATAEGPDFPIETGLVRVSRIDLPPVGAAEVPAVPEVGAVHEVETVPPVAVDAPLDPPPPAPLDPPLDEPSPFGSDSEPDTEDIVAPDPGLPSQVEPWSEPSDQDLPAAAPDADPQTEHIPTVPPPPPPPQSWGDLPPPPPPQPGPWGDAGLGDATPPPPPPPPLAGDSDHDGFTQAGADADESESEQPGIPGQPMAPAVTRPVAKLLISSGETVDVDRVVLIGRAPEARRFTSTDQPRLVTVPSPMHEISSTHVEVRPGSGADHGSAVVTDMGSTNGTVLVQPGLPPEDLKPGIAVQLIPGAIINLGDGLTIQVARP